MRVGARHPHFKDHHSAKAIAWEGMGYMGELGLEGLSSSWGKCTETMARPRSYKNLPVKTAENSVPPHVRHGRWGMGLVFLDG
jgi:hypothetical protein